MKKISILIIANAIIISFISAFPLAHAQGVSWWISETEECTVANSLDVSQYTEKLVPKVEWKNKLCVKQQKKLRLYSSVVENIVTSWISSCTATYFLQIDNNAKKALIDVNPKLADTSVFANSLLYWNDKNMFWKNGVSSNLGQKNPLCNGVIVQAPDPNTTIDWWEIKSKVYYYDVSAPKCDSPTYYEGADIVSYNGGWTNKQLSAVFTCSDLLSGCPDTQKSSKPIALAHKDTNADVTFEDVVENKKTLSCELPAQYLYDPTAPELTVTDDSGKKLIENGKVTSWNWAYYAGKRKFDIYLADKWSQENPWVSGVKNLKMKITRISNADGTPSNDIVCSIDKSYSTTNEYLLDEKRETLDCSDVSGIQVSGKYKADISYSDNADNIINFTIPNIIISPNLQVKLSNSYTVEPQVWGTASSCVRYNTENICTNWNTTPKSYQSQTTCLTESQVQESIKPLRIYGFAPNLWAGETLVEWSQTITPDKFSRCGSFLNFGTRKYEYTITYAYQTKSCSQYAPKNTTCAEERNSPGFASTEEGNIYANHSDRLFYTFSKIVDSYNNPIRSKNIKIEHTWSGIYLIQWNKDSGSALDLSKTSFNNVTSSSGEVWSVGMSSYAPGYFTDAFTLTLPSWNPDNSLKSDTLSITAWDNKTHQFRPLYKAESINLSWSGIINFGTKQTLIATLSGTHTLNKPEKLSADLTKFLRPTPTSWSIEQPFQSTQLVQNNTAKIDFIGVQKERIENGKTIGVVALPIVSYTLDGKGVSYYVSQLEFITLPSLFDPVKNPEDDPTNSNNTIADRITPPGDAASRITPQIIRDSFATSNNSLTTFTNSIFIGGQAQATGNQAVVANLNKIGQNTWVTARNGIAKEVANLTRNRNPDGTVVNNVKYHKGDITLSGDITWYQTLIIEDGNLTINGDLNPSKANIGIILINKNDTSKGNIYITPNVQFVGATIFADGSVISVREATNHDFIIKEDRDTSLSKKQIVFYGSLYTRNTVGWATLNANSQYSLPNGEFTTDVETALQYDLSQLRLQDADSTKIPTDYYSSNSQGRKESVVIWPNKAQLSNPPIGFDISW